MASTDPVVAVVGSYNVGLTMQVPAFPAPGETVVGREFAEGPGGKGSNQAIAAARLGAESRFAGRVGADRYGDDAVALWEAEGVDAEAVGRDDAAHTGVGFVVVDEDGENEITVAPGANDRLSAADVRERAAAIETADCLLVQLEIGDEPVRAAVETAAEAGTTVVCNPAPARELPPAVLEQVDYLTPNEHEARTLAGVARDDDETGSDSDITDEAVARELLGLGVGAVVLTRGSAGALLVSDDGVEGVEAPSVEVVDTTGAGDAFNGALAVALAEGLDARAAVRFGCAGGALAVTAPEVVPGLPERGAVDDLVAESW
ncbi:ribokinase [Halosimplex carlsbadense 2-9-1]|uniref:Ribokinase n=1 Tax=Halosimplex carlsbadense 2-9-1 TaxID=797114 RepID=M0CJ07_9EURY|nr:ribokinase [Halosimplex carlsbadense]ELZ22352.1 ribokinase [Halosimplex carlsbadense 2-9-1]